MEKSEYSKKPLSISEQLSLLRSRGIVIEISEFAKHVLKTVSYYRFSAYLHPFKSKEIPDEYICGTSFNLCWQYYRFDRRLRFILIDAIERIEVATKTKIVNHFSEKYGAFGYRNPENYAKPFDSKRFFDLLNFVDEETKKARKNLWNIFVKTIMSTMYCQFGWLWR